MPTSTRNRPARKTARTLKTTAARLRPGHRLTAWAREPVTVVAVTRLAARRWSVTVAYPSGALETAGFVAGQILTREV